MSQIAYPYIPEGRTLLYVPEGNPFIRLAKEFARKESKDKTMPGAAVVVRGGLFLGIGANGSDYHEKVGCRRVALGCKTGEGYELCEGCHPKNHSEPKAIADAVARGHTTNGSDLYLWGHWWCCQWCWDCMTKAGIKNVFLLVGSEILFNKQSPENIVGRQFE